MNAKLENFRKEREEKRNRLDTMAKKVKLKVTKPYGPFGDYVFVDARRNNIFGHAEDLDSAIAYLQKRFPQLAKEV